MDGDIRERLIASEPVFAGTLLSVRVDEVALPEGARTRREVVVHPGAVAIVPMLGDGKVVMIRQYRHAAGRVLYELPAGTLRPGEAPLDCARRELAEETGYEAGEMRPLFSVYLSPGYSTECIHLFFASQLKPRARAADADEHVEPVAVPLEDAVGMVGRGEVQNAAAVCGLLAAARWGDRLSGRRGAAGH
jgi:ADP-ribose pyrophosphatase